MTDREMKFKLDWVFSMLIAGRDEAAAELLQLVYNELDKRIEADVYEYD